MATDTVVKNPAQAVGQSAPETAEQKAARINAAIKAIPSDVMAELYKVTTLVNNLPEDWQTLLNLGAEVQAEYSNPTDYKVAMLPDAIRAYVKAQARMAVTTWDNAIGKHSKLFPKLTREECIAELLKKQSGKQLHRMATVGTAITSQLK